MKLYHLRILWLVFAFSVAIGSVTTRNDAIKEIIAKEGVWAANNWADPVFCDPGKFATGFVLRVWIATSDVNRFQEDDVGATSMGLYCKDSDKPLETSNLNSAPWGQWSAVNCPYNSYIMGFKTKVAGDQGDYLGNSYGHLDDVSLVSVRAECSDSSRTSIEPNGGSADWASYFSKLQNEGVSMDWGDFTTRFAECPARSTVCGFRQSVYGSCGNCDDTGLEAVRLYCCTNPKVLSYPRGFWYRVAGGGGGATVKYTQKVGVSNHESSELTKDFTAAVTASLSAGFAFVDVTVSASVSYSITQKTITSTTMTKEKTLEVSCPSSSDALYQWRYKLREDAMTEIFEFEIGTPDHWCISTNDKEPQCPFGYCAAGDKDCQTCTAEFDKSKLKSAGAAIYNVVEVDHHNYYPTLYSYYVYIGLALAVIALALYIVFVFCKAKKSHTQTYHKVVSVDEDI